MRSMKMIAASAIATAVGLMGLSAPAQAASIVCNIGTPVHCVIVPSAKPAVMTSTSVNVTPEPALFGSTLTLHGSVIPLLSGASGNNHGTARIYFVRVGTTASAYMGSVPVSASGAFGTTFPASHTGSWWATYSGNASTTAVNGRVGSTSGRDYVQVRKVFATTVIVGTSPHAMTTYTTSYRPTVNGVPLIVSYTLRCSSPVGTFKISTRGGNPVDHQMSAVTLSSGRTALSGSVLLGNSDVATAVRVQTGALCSVSIRATQTRVVQIN